MSQAIFEILGFKEDEAKTYLSLIESGMQTASDLAKIVGVPRPTIYGYLERLIAAGLVREEINRGTKHFIAATPLRLRALYRNKVRELRSQEEPLNSLIGELENRTGADLLSPGLTNFDGRKGLQAALEDILLCRPDAQTLAFWPIRAVLNMLSPEYLAYHAKARIRRNIHVQSIWPRMQGLDISQHPHMAWGPEFRAELRYAPMGIEPVIAFWVYGQKTLFLTSREEAKGFVIASADMAKMMAVQHQQVWMASEPVPFDRNAANGFIQEIAA